MFNVTIKMCANVFLAGNIYLFPSSFVIRKLVLNSIPSGIKEKS